MLRLRLPFQEMAHKHGKTAFQFVTVATAHASEFPRNPHGASRTVARALRPLASMTVSRAKPMSPGCQ